MSGMGRNEVGVCWEVKHEVHGGWGIALRCMNVAWDLRLVSVIPGVKVVY